MTIALVETALDGVKKYIVRFVHHRDKHGLIPSLLNGIGEASESNNLIMDKDFSHASEPTPKFSVETKESYDSVVIECQYTTDGRVKCWPLRGLIISHGAA